MSSESRGREGLPAPQETETGTTSELEAIIARLEKLSDPETLRSVEKTETSLEKMEELYNFYGKFYDKNEMLMLSRCGTE